MVNDWIVIGISGVTCGGKTTLANRLRDALVPVYVFHQDKYFLPDDSPKHVRCPGVEHNNYDILSALDMDKMHDDVLRTLRGETRAHAVDLERAEGKWGVPGKSFLILEGFTVLNHRPLNELCHLRYYFVLEYGECASRRALRLYDPPDTAGYFEQCVWPEHLRFKAQIEKDSRVKMLDGTSPDAFEVVLKDLTESGASRL
ncbi:unnamed protein product [Pieris macdunnoughi]|uniref:Nicotinamide riboside kinase 1 n=1 Tax=Pieris macdunnoughi TaxID=345717 RepID=A0A821Y286_9NEOP|nr:unnamed protein product [Pieris macdunnoughi]